MIAFLEVLAAELRMQADRLRRRRARKRRTRTDEVDAVAAKHAGTHPTRCRTEPEEAK